MCGMIYTHIKIYKKGIYKNINRGYTFMMRFNKF